MSPHTLEASNLGPIRHAHVRLGDLTVFVGPQATGKSILLQFLKLVLDAGSITAEMRRQGLDWDKRLDRFLEVYLGERMSGVWQPGESKLKFDGRSVPWRAWIDPAGEEKMEALFYIPAQRVLTLGRGWPRPFSDYSPGDPYVVRDFSENIRRLVESPRLTQRVSLFPKTHWLKSEFRTISARNDLRGFWSSDRSILAAEEAGAQGQIQRRAPSLHGLVRRPARSCSPAAESLLPFTGVARSRAGKSLGRHRRAGTGTAPSRDLGRIVTCLGVTRLE